MAAATKPTSRWVSSYSDKTLEWVQARLEHYEGLERISRTGSLTRRREIRQLRVELLNRKKASEAVAVPAPAPAKAPAKAQVPAAVSAPPTVQRGAYSPVSR